VPNVTKKRPGMKRIKRMKMRKTRRKMKIDRGKLSSKKKKIRGLDEPQKSREQLNIIDEKEREVTRTLGDPALAKRVLTLQKKNPLGTLPELVAMDWLNSRHFQYYYQVHVLGGRRAGGLVHDFVIPQSASSTLALLVNGSYWHSGFAQKEQDSSAKIRLIGTNVFGFHIDQVVEVWDTKLYSDRDKTMNAAMAGVELGL
jgi:hypothetical protein